MENRQHLSAFITELAKRFVMTFSTAIFILSLTGIILTRFFSQITDLPALQIIGITGLSYGTIFQLAVVSFLLSVISIFLFSEYSQITAPFILRSVLLLISTITITSVFAAVFRWFPINILSTWILFIVCTTVCFSASFCITMIKMKYESRKYNKLLASFKKKRIC